MRCLRLELRLAVLRTDLRIFIRSGSFAYHKQEIAERRQSPGRKTGCGLKADLRDEAFRAENLVHHLAHMMQVGVRHLHEDAARWMKQFPCQQ